MWVFNSLHSRGLVFVSFALGIGFAIPVKGRPVILFDIFSVALEWF